MVESGDKKRRGKFKGTDVDDEHVTPTTAVTMKCSELKDDLGLLVDLAKIELFMAKLLFQV